MDAYATNRHRRRFYYAIINYHACTLMRTCAKPGSGMLCSTTSKGPLGLETCIARIHIFFYLRYSMLYEQLQLVARSCIVTIKFE